MNELESDRRRITVVTKKFLRFTLSTDTRSAILEEAYCLLNTDYDRDSNSI